MGRFNINRNLLPMKGHFFAFNAGTAPLVPFMPTFAKQLGFSSVAVGLIYTCLPISGLLIKPLFGALADKLQIRKLLFLIFQIVTAVTFFGMNFIPNLPLDSKISLNCGGNETVLNTCTYNKTDNNECAASNFISLGDRENVTCQLKCSINDENKWETICSYWHFKEYCNISMSENPVLEFTALIPLNETIRNENCIKFKVNYHTVNDEFQTFPVCPSSNQINTICDITCDSASEMQFILEPKSNDTILWGMYQFWIFFMLLLFSWIGMAVVVSVGDAICFEMLGDKPHKYGHQRLFGSIGWGLFSIIAGLLVDYFSKDQMYKNYTPVFYLMLVMMTIDVLVSSRLKHKQTKQSSSLFMDVGKLLCQFQVIIFVLWCILVGLCTGLLWQFLFWYLEDLASKQNGCNAQDYIKTLEGLIMGIQCFLGELPFFFLSGWILKKIGHVNAMSLVLIGFGIRFVLYSFLTNPWWCLPIEMLNGITFGIFYATMASYASIIAPPGTEATMQGLAGAIFEGLGVSLGSGIGGYLFNAYGGVVTFRSFGIVSLIAGILRLLIRGPKTTHVSLSEL